MSSKSLRRASLDVSSPLGHEVEVHREPTHLVAPPAQGIADPRRKVTARQRKEAVAEHVSRPLDVARQPARLIVRHHDTNLNQKTSAMDQFTSLLTTALVGTTGAAPATAASMILGGHVKPPPAQGLTRALELNLIVIGHGRVIAIDD